MSDVMSDDLTGALAISRALLHLYPAPTPDDLNAVVRRALLAFPDVDAERLTAALETEYSIWQPDSLMMFDNEDHRHWLPARGSAIRWAFWERYREYLKIEKHFPVGVIQKVDEMTGQILEQLEDPQREGKWRRYGMVVGQVQSGKTANYTGLICKAADAGYKLIIILTGSHNSLRSQTQLRIDEGFLGQDTNQDRIYHQDSDRIGVGRLPGPRPDVIPLTTSHEMGDFRKRTAESFTLPTGTIPYFLIVKKNGAVLKTLLEWIGLRMAVRNSEGERLVPGVVPLLLIDDEADFASINTRELRRDEDGNLAEQQEVTRINGLIRHLLKTFERRAYIGYTATPFANIFISPGVSTPELGEDLFPRSFILNLHPPSNYVGPAEVFGLNSAAGSEPESLPILRPVDDADAVFPVKHRADIAFRITSLPPSLIRALRSFLLVCAARSARGDYRAHNSMLVHVTRFVDVQSKTEEVLRRELYLLQSRLRDGDGGRSPSLFDEMRQLWEEDFVPTTEAIRAEKLLNDAVLLTPLTWEQVEPYLYAAAEKVRVKRINSKSADALDYYEHREHGINIIAVGGDKLSRGLTLEGLSVSYYLRFTQMYDTLMQMGRWFGYRPGYGDLCRLYTTPELIAWYGMITQASEELRREFDAMVRLQMTPRDFGLKVQTHPGLLVTSATKSRTGVKVRVSYTGHLVETYRLLKEASVIQENFDLLESFVRLLGDPEPKTGARKRPLLWRGVPATRICDFLTGYQAAPNTPPDPASIPARLAEFIHKKGQRGELTEWTVALADVSEGRVKEIGGQDIGMSKRSPATTSPDSEAIYRIIKNHIIDRAHEWVDLSPQELATAIEIRRAGEADEEKKRRISEPNGESARQVRPRQRGLLLLYALDPAFVFDVNDSGRQGPPITGFAISFPGYGRTDAPDDAVEYLANEIFVQEWQDEDFVEEESDSHEH